MTLKDEVLLEIRNRVKKALSRVMDEAFIGPSIANIHVILEDAIDSHPKKRCCALCEGEKPVAKRTSTDPQNPKKILVCKDCMSKYFSISLFDHYEYF